MGGMCLINTRTRLASSCSEQIDRTPSKLILKWCPSQPFEWQRRPNTNAMNFICGTHYHLPRTEKNINLLGKQDLRGRLGQQAWPRPGEQTMYTLEDSPPSPSSFAWSPFPAVQMPSCLCTDCVVTQVPLGFSEDIPERELGGFHVLKRMQPVGRQNIFPSP